jgi:hypothetical protein
MHIAVIFFFICLLVGLSPILATIKPNYSQPEQATIDSGIAPKPTKLDMYIDPETMDIHEQPEGLDKSRK